MATYQAVAQTQSSWSSSCERTSPRCGRKQMATYQAVGQTQSSCLIAARERPRAGSKQMATNQAVVAQTQSKQQLIEFVLLSCYTNLVCSRRSLAPIHYPRCIINECCVAHTYTAQTSNCAAAILLYSTYFLAHAAASCLLHFSLSLYFSHLCLFSTKNKLAKLKGLLRVQPISRRRKDESQRGFISVRYYEV